MNAEMLTLIVVIGSSLWVYIDAKRIGVKKGQIKGVWNVGPEMWCLACLLLWIVCFPMYLIKRPEYLRVNSTT